MSRRRTQPRPSTSAPPTPRPERRPPATRLVAAGAPWWLHALALLTVAALAGLPYLPSLGGDFVYDDPNAVTQSTLIRSLTPVRTFLALSTRPLTDYSYAINYAIGGLDPAVYHVTGVVLHVCTALLAYAMAWLILGLPSLVPRYGAGRQRIAWAAAALFAAHPLASETVAYISSRSESLAAMWYLVAVIGFLRATAAAGGARTAWVGLMSFAAVAGAASKETVFTLAGVLPLLDWLLIADRRWRRVHWQLIAIPLLPLAFVGFVLVVRAFSGQMSLGDYAATAGFSFDRFGPMQYLATQFGVVVHYLRLAVLPIGQTFDYDWPLATIYHPLAVAIPLVILLALVYGAWRLRATQPLATFVAGWVLMILSLTSSFMPIADLAVERRMYLPLVGLMLLASAWLYDLCARLPAEWRRRPALTYGLAAAALLAALVPATWQRAALWGDAIALHEDGVRRAPGNPRMRLNLGVTYLNSGDAQRAYETLVEAKRIFDRGESVQAFPRIGAFIHYNLGAVLFARKAYDEAETQLERSLELGGQYLALRPMANMLLSRVDAQRGDYKAAIDHLAEALKYRDDPDWVVDMVQMKLKAGDRLGAGMQLNALLKQHPELPRARQLKQRMDAENAAAARAPKPPAPAP
jgi:tetratricopeptide (TPR) repeat protein